VPGNLWIIGYYGLKFKVQGSRFKVQGSRFRVQGSGFKVQGSRFKVQGSGFKVMGSRHDAAPASSVFGHRSFVLLLSAQCSAPSLTGIYEFYLIVIIGVIVISRRQEPQEPLVRGLTLRDICRCVLGVLPNRIWIKKGEEKLPPHTPHL